MSFSIVPATRVGIKPLVGFYGKSSSGKTNSALLYARGIVGPKGRIVLIDSESRRGSYFANVIPGGYGVIDLDPPFSPSRYDEAISHAEQNADVVVVDSLTHEHAGDGGVLDMQEAELYRMAKDDYTKREQCKMAAWIKPKKEHGDFIGHLLRLKCALVVCLRGEEKTHFAKDRDNKRVVVTDEFSSPIFDKRFIFEMTVNFETVARSGKGGFVVPRKLPPEFTSPGLIPDEDEQIGVNHGEALAAWCAAPKGPGSKKPVTSIAKLKNELWDLTVSKHNGDKRALSQWLIDESCISDTESLETLAEARFPEVIEKAKAKLQLITT